MDYPEGCLLGRNCVDMICWRLPRASNELKRVFPPFSFLFSPCYLLLYPGISVPDRLRNPPVVFSSSRHLRATFWCRNRSCRFAGVPFWCRLRFRDRRLCMNEEGKRAVRTDHSISFRNLLLFPLSIRHRRMRRTTYVDLNKIINYQSQIVKQRILSWLNEILRKIYLRRCIYNVC